MAATFLRFAHRRVRVLGNLSDSAYGIFPVHYVPVTWLQYGLLKVDLPATAKGLLVPALRVSVSPLLVGG
ncbi:MAG: hypothetical protein V1912_11615 [bacterium]